MYRFEIFDQVSVPGLRAESLKILKQFKDTDGSKLYNLKGLLDGYTILVFSVPEQRINHES